MKIKAKFELVREGKCNSLVKGKENTVAHNTIEQDQRRNHRTDSNTKKKEETQRERKREGDDDGQRERERD